MSKGLGYTVPEPIKANIIPNFAGVCGKTCPVPSLRATAKQSLSDGIASSLHSSQKHLETLAKLGIIKLREVQTTFKSTPILGFLGTFSVNFEIPDYWGIGKSVSRGFGTVVRN